MFHYLKYLKANGTYYLPRRDMLVLLYISNNSRKKYHRIDIVNYTGLIEKTVKLIIHRLKEQGFISKEHKGATRKYRLTQKGRNKLKEIQDFIKLNNKQWNNQQ